MELKRIKEFFQRTIGNADAALAHFKERLDKDPVHAFVWSEDVMQKTARADVARHYLAGIEQWEADREAGTLGEAQPKDEDGVVEFIKSSVIRVALRECSSVKRSTSTMSNFMDAEKSAFYAHVADDWNLLYA